MAGDKRATATFPQQLFAGGVAGVSELLIMYPLDVVKTRMQLQRTTGSAMASPGMLQCFRKIAVEEGVSRFYRGIMAPILMETPKRATKFAANDFWAKWYRDLFQTQGKSQAFAILTGASAGATESIVVVPFELVKIRLQDKRSAARYSGVLNCAVSVVRESGPLGLYQGFESTVWRHIVWNAGYFGCIFQVRSLLTPADSGQSSTASDLLAGSIGGTVGTLLNTPFDVVKSRVQSTAKPASGGVKIPWVWAGIAKIYREEGFRALYKGLVPKIVRFAPGGGIMLVVYSTVLDLLTSA